VKNTFRASPCLSAACYNNNGPGGHCSFVTVILIPVVIVIPTVILTSVIIIIIVAISIDIVIVT
jgi:hypothetical protein